VAEVLYSDVVCAIGTVGCGEEATIVLGDIDTIAETPDGKFDWTLAIEGICRS
jgi:hypothetical protein